MRLPAAMGRMFVDGARSPAPRMAPPNPGWPITRGQHGGEGWTTANPGGLPWRMHASAPTGQQEPWYARVQEW